MNEHPPTEGAFASRQPGVALGVFLVVVGALLFAGQLVDIGIGDLAWPYWIIGIGLAILLVGLLLVVEAPIVIGGTVVTVVGAVLLYQETTGHWESWAYAWALVGPAASGLGVVLHGLRTADVSAVRRGVWGLLGGVAIFAVGLLFFEGVIGISGRRLPLPEWTVPVAVIAVGVVILLRGLLQDGSQPLEGRR